MSTGQPSIASQVTLHYEITVYCNICATELGRFLYTDERQAKDTRNTHIRAHRSILLLLGIVRVCQQVMQPRSVQP
jgi:hypothetical protein